MPPNFNTKIIIAVIVFLLLFGLMISRSRGKPQQEQEEPVKKPTQKKDGPKKKPQKGK